MKRYSRHSPFSFLTRVFSLLLIGLVLLGTIPVAQGATETVEQLLATQPQKYPNQQELLKLYAISKINVMMLLQYHYESKELTPELAKTWFQEYFKQLDPFRLYFRQSDMDELSKYEGLWLFRQKGINFPLVHAVYKRYLKRVKERAIFVDRFLAKKQDFTIKESLPLDRTEAPFPANEKEQLELWRKYAKNEVLVLKLERERTAANPKKKSGKKEDGEQQKQKTEEEELEAIRKRYARFYKAKAEAQMVEIEEYCLNALCHLFDPHTSYMAPASREDFDINMSLSLSGIGATLSQQESYTTVVDLIPGGPADLDGRIQIGDKIIEVTQEGGEPVDVVEMPLSKVVKQIRGPKGTKVTLTILHKGMRNPVVITLVRDKIKLVNQEAKSSLHKIKVPGQKKAKRILVVHLPLFYSDFQAKIQGDPNYKSTTTDIRKLLKEAQKDEPLDGVILDLRGNGGGALEEAISLTGLFLPTGPVVQIRNKNNKIEKRIDPDSSICFAGPLLMMTDRFSASASEITAAALQDQGRALVVGDRQTHGKGTVQQLFDLSRRPEIQLGTLKFTSAKFYRINGESTQLKGVIPDIILPSFTDHMKLGESNIPHALSWDTISSMKYYNRNELRAKLPFLQKQSAARLANSPAFARYRQEIERYKKMQELKELPLQYKERKLFEEQQTKADESFRAFLESNENLKQDRSAKKKKDKKTQGKDLILEETLSIMGDILQ